MAYYEDFMKSKTIDSQVKNMYGDNPIHNQHIDEFRQMTETMINEALRNYSEQVQLDVQTTLNGKPLTMSGLVADVRKQVSEMMRKAFRK